MHCPFCQQDNSKVLETRMPGQFEIRRRRHCLSCQSRFTTIESLFVKYPHVIKKDGSRQPFSPQKLRGGIQLACLKRPVSLPQTEEMVRKISDWALSGNKKEVKSLEIGKKVMEELKQVDDVAYVRFASVYRTFKDVQEFLETLGKESSP